VQEHMAMSSNSESARMVFTVFTERQRSATGASRR
jgi:hypothetical protein